MNEKLGMKQYLVPYLMSSHPGSTLKEAIESGGIPAGSRAICRSRCRTFIRHPQPFPPVCIIQAWIRRTMEPVYVPNNPHEKAMQRALMQYRLPEKPSPLVMEALETSRAVRILSGTVRNV